MPQFRKIWDIDLSFEKHLKLGTISKNDENLIREYIGELQATRHIGDSRRAMIVIILINWRRFIPRPYNEISIGEIYTSIDALKHGTSNKGKPFAQITIRDYIVTLKAFLKWLQSNNYTTIRLDKINNIKIVSITASSYTDADNLTQSDILTLVKSAINARDKALISTLFESGARISEISHLKWHDITTDKYGIKLRLTDTKTNKLRYTRLVWANSYLATWRNQYPGAPEGDVPVFVTIKGDPITYMATRGILKRAVKRCNFQKKYNAHNFRHSRVNNMVEMNFQESVMKESIWGNVDSRMLRTYLKLSEQSIDREFLARAGITTDDNIRPEPLKSGPCPRCHTLCAPTVHYCPNCGMQLTGEAIADMDTVKQSIAQQIELYKKTIDDLMKLQQQT